MSLEKSLPRISLVSLNIERDRHLERIVPFLQNTRPDIICLQEVMEADFHDLKARFGWEGIFAPMTLARPSLPERGIKPLPLGVGLFSRLPIIASGAHYYYGDPAGALCESRYLPDGRLEPMCIKKALVWATIVQESEMFTIGTTHFTWSLAGEADENQRRDSDALLAILETIPHIAWCGDLNAPRGREIFAKFAARYRDHIPPHYTSSLSASLHRAGPLSLMVDGLFSTPHYAAADVELVDGLSDHLAIRATLRRNAA